MFKFVSLRLGACLLSGAACAAPPPALTLDAVHAKVLQHNLALRSLSRETLAQDGLVRQAGALPNPELSGLVEDRNGSNRSTTVMLTQPIETGGKRAARIDAALRERDLAEASLRLKRAELRADTHMAYVGLLVAQARVALADTGLALARQGLAVASGRVRAGKNSPLDETRARIAAAGAAVELAQAQTQRDTARDLLAALWGGSGDELGNEVAASPALPPEPASLAVLLDRLAQAPAIALADSQLQRRLALGRVEGARRMPDVALSVGSKKEDLAGRRQAVFGLALPLPLFDRNQGRLQEALQRTEQARDELAAARTAVAGELRVAHRRLVAARGQVLALEREQLPDARSTVETIRKGYEYGKFTILDVVDAQRVLLQAQDQQLRLLGEAHGAAADIERLLGAQSAALHPDTP